MAIHTPIQNTKRVVKIKNDNLLKNVKITFVDLPPYSPDLNIVEYWIHLMRLKFVHNSPKLKLETIKENIRRFKNNNLFLQKESISNILIGWKYATVFRAAIIAKFCS